MTLGTYKIRVKYLRFLEGEWCGHCFLCPSLLECSLCGCRAELGRSHFRWPGEAQGLGYWEPGSSTRDSLGMPKLSSKSNAFTF